MTATVFQKDVIGNVCSEQEDSHNILNTPNGDVFVVCDGMGGHAGGKKASSLAVESITEYLKREEYANPLQALMDALQFANMQILGYASQNIEFKGMGTTACILLLKADNAYIAHVGDSRIYLYLGEEKQLHRITKDHSYVQTLVDAGEITDEEAEHHPNKNRILKALGIKPELLPSFNYQDRAVLPKKGDVFLICSDGLNSMISDGTIKRVLSGEGTLEQKGDMLINLALEGENGYPGGQDNITVELIQIENSVHKKSEFTSFNPISKNPISRTQELDANSGKLMIIMKWVAAAFVLVMVVFVGGLYFYGNYNKNIELKPLISERDKMQKEFDTTNDSLNDIMRWQTTLEKSKEYAESSGAPGGYDQEKYRANSDNILILEKDSTVYKGNLDSIKSRISNIERRPFYKFLLPRKNESNNNRKRSKK